MMRQMLFPVLCAIILTSFPNSTASVPAALVLSDDAFFFEQRWAAPRVDSTIVVLIDITDDGLLDSLIVRVEGESMERPLHWSVEIKSEGRAIYRHSSDRATDTWLDEHFGEPGWGDKASFYFSTLPGRLAERVQLTDRNTMFQRDAPNGIYALIPQELKKRGVSDQSEIDAVIAGIIERLKTGTVVLSIPISPLQDRAPMIYVPEIGEFLTFYKE